ncbi:PHP domain-containing protein [Trichothermofontia sichuanensis B231]|uniref:PHP domain-containing protein n=1 Tax=Trichothermofontia sichuanensis TaxID=3045816 RepID=UPI002248325C|nr:PHP domain-containing protein [Trichothermofontia sichuanensis]UZQ55429.1 PHP domain-containing protein [Trichothermofontia sichuanensis B231]
MTTTYFASAPVGQRSLPAQPLRQTLRQVFRQLHAESCPHTYNFHLHSTCSDGQLDPEAIVEQAIMGGLHGLAITDHHSIEGFQRAQQRLMAWSWSHPETPIALEIWSGVEINAGLLDTEVHILGYGFQPNHPALCPYLQGRTATGPAYQAVAVIQAIHRAGGIAVLAHPMRYRRRPEDLIPAAAALGIDGVETYYAYDNPNPWRPSLAQIDRVWRLGERYGLLHTCGTDTHGNSILQRL